MKSITFITSVLQTGFQCSLDVFDSFPVGGSDADVDSSGGDDPYWPKREAGSFGDALQELNPVVLAPDISLIRWKFIHLGPFGSFSCGVFRSALILQTLVVKILDT